MSPLRLALIGACCALAVACDHARIEDRLTADEVRNTFVGPAWYDRNGTWQFAPDGTWRFEGGVGIEAGTYDIDREGELCATTREGTRYLGLTNCLTFYREGVRHAYFETRTRRSWAIWPAAAGKD